jgi:hypothetical protein
MSLPDETHAFLETLRAGSRAQRDLWRRVPYLALQIYCRTFDLHLIDAYESGLWFLPPPAGAETSQAAVDLASGELVGVDPGDPFRPANDAAIIALLLDPTPLHAHTLVSTLTLRLNETNQSPARTGGLLDQQAHECTAKLAGRHGVAEDYVRPVATSSSTR